MVDPKQPVPPQNPQRVEQGRTDAERTADRNRNLSANQTQAERDAAKQAEHDKANREQAALGTGGTTNPPVVSPPIVSENQVDHERIAELNKNKDRDEAARNAARTADQTAARTGDETRKEEIEPRPGETDADRLERVAGQNRRV